MVAALAVVLALAAGGAKPPDEYQVKAAFLYNFARFVHWPDEEAGGPLPRPFVITVLGDDPSGGVLGETLRGKSVDGRALEVRHARGLDELRASQIVFVSDSTRARLVDVLAHLEGTSTLTVGEMDQFAEKGGVIRFRTEGERVRLEVNTQAADRAGLRISSELLKLARIVRPRRGL